MIKKEDKNKSNSIWLFYELRPTHWIKNILIFLPLVFSFQLTDIRAIISSTLAFISFCCLASAGYVLNDLIDLRQDQHHPVKRLRPLASGKVQLHQAKILIGCLLVAAFYIALLFLDLKYVFVLAGYFLLQVSYVVFLKRIVIVDVMALAGFYILRILAGLVAIDTKISYWMIICIGLLALFIGFNKRRHEHQMLQKKASSHREVLAHYGAYFIDQMIVAICATLLMSYTLYTVDVETFARFGTHQLLWTTVFVYYGVFRYLYIVHKRHKGGDPVRILLSDCPMMINCGLWILSCILIIYIEK